MTFLSLAEVWRLLALVAIERFWATPAGERVATYGARWAGIQLAPALRQVDEMYPGTFVDDDAKLRRLRSPAFRCTRPSTCRA